MSLSSASTMLINTAIHEVTRDPYHGLPRIAVLVASENDTLLEGSGGFATLPPYPSDSLAISASPEASTESIYDLYSLTKLVCIIAALQLAEEGRIDLAANAATYVRDLEDVNVIIGFKEGGEPVLERNTIPITVEQLILHTCGTAYPGNPSLKKYFESKGMSNFSLYGDGTSKATLASIPLVATPGAEWNYGFGTDWLGLIVESVTGTGLEEYFQENIFKPLGILDMSFVTNPDLISLASTPADTTKPFSFSAGRRYNQSQYWGGGGMSGSPKSYLKLLQTLLAGGGPILKPESVDKLFEPRLTPKQQIDVTQKLKSMVHPYSFWAVEPFPADWGYGGFITATDLPSGRKKGTLSWSGVGNTFWFIDRETGIAFVIFTNTMPTRPPQLWSVWDKIETAIYEGFTKNDSEVGV